MIKRRDMMPLCSQIQANVCFQPIGKTEHVLSLCFQTLCFVNTSGESFISIKHSEDLCLSMLDLYSNNIGFTQFISRVFVILEKPIFSSYLLCFPWFGS